MSEFNEVESKEWEIAGCQSSIKESVPQGANLVQFYNDDSSGFYVSIFLNDGQLGGCGEGTLSKYHPCEPGDTVHVRAGKFSKPDENASGTYRFYKK